MPMPEMPAHLTAPAMDGARPVPRHQGADSEDLLPLSPNYRFHLVHYADDAGGWFVATVPGRGAYWLPRLTRIPEKPGLKGMHTIKRGQDPRMAYLDAHKRVELDGGRVIPDSLGYCVGKACRDPKTGSIGTYYVDAWMAPKARVRGKRQKFNFDRGRYYSWLLWLVEAGYVDPPHPDIVDIRRAQLAARVDRREAINYQGDEELEAKHVGAAAELASQAAEAKVPQEAPRAYPTPEVPAEPEVRETVSMTELRKQARALGYKTSRKSRADLEAIVAEGVPADEVVDPVED